MGGEGLEVLQGNTGDRPARKLHNSGNKTDR